jgi:peptidoglycan biosynthesis protein MviN/MurJ (putative lipid II flippase)
VNVAASTVLLVMMRRRLGLEQVGRTVGVVARVVVAGAFAAASAFAVWYVLDAWLGESLLAQLVSLGAGFAAGAVLYLASARALGVRELEALLLLRARREVPDER